MPYPVSHSVLLALVVAIALGGCAQRGGGPTTVVATDPTDPYEETNRKVLDLNWTLDDAVMKPVAKGYRQALGPWPRARIRNFLRNLTEPSVFINRALQGRPLLAGESLMRFVINSTLGVAGFFDLADIGGPKRQVADFGQTLAVWGVGDGPYLMLPVLGPSNAREVAGLVGNGVLNPIGYALPFAHLVGRAVGVGRQVVSGVGERERNLETIDDIRYGSLDSYARLRSLWRQNRDAELGRKQATEPDVLDDPGANASTAAQIAAPVAAATPTPSAEPKTARPKAKRQEAKRRSRPSHATMIEGS
jgi:phospholipid-binding lipoprotein MlaA